MVSAVHRGVRITGVNAKSFLLTGLVIIVVVALFLVPEIAEFRSGDSKSALNFPTDIFSGEGRQSVSDAENSSGELGVPEDVSVEEILRDAENAALAKRQGSGAELELNSRSAKGDEIAGSELSDIEAMLSGDAQQEMRAKRMLEAKKATTTDAEQPAPKEDSRFSWEVLRTSESRDAIRSAAKEAVSIAESLPHTKRGSRYALFNFAAAAYYVLGKASESLSAEEAVRFLELSHNGVRPYLDREDIPRASYNRWGAVRLGPAVEKYGALRSAATSKYFEPALNLVGFKFSKAGDRKGRWVEQTPLYVTIRGNVQGADVARIEVLRNGRLVWSGKPRKPNVLGLRNFTTPRLAGKGVISFRVYDKYGQVSERHYNFYPRVMRFPWDGGRFRLPYFGEEDRRLNSYFMFRSSRGSGLGGSRNFFDNAQFERF